jgi:hypothetical protein
MPFVGQYLKVNEQLLRDMTADPSGVDSPLEGLRQEEHTDHDDRGGDQWSIPHNSIAPGLQRCSP